MCSQDAVVCLSALILRFETPPDRDRTPWMPVRVDGRRCWTQQTPGGGDGSSPHVRDRAAVQTPDALGGVEGARGCLRLQPCDRPEISRSPDPDDPHAAKMLAVRRIP